MPCGDPVAGWRAQLNYATRAQALQGGPPGMPYINLYLAGLWVVGGLATAITPLYPVRVLYSLVNGSLNLAFLLVYLAVYYLASFWAGQVTQVVPGPYLVCYILMINIGFLTIYRMKCFIFLKLKRIVAEDSMSGIRSSRHLLACKSLPISYKEKY